MGVSVALSIHQPYASAIAAGVKRVENRTWGSDQMAGMPLAIHATSKRWNPTPLERSRIQRLWPDCPPPQKFPYGAILATARIKLVCGTKHIAVSGDRWATGPKCWVLDRIVALHTPISHKGKQGLWKLSNPVQERIAGDGTLPSRWPVKPCPCGSGLKPNVLIASADADYLRCVECTGIRTKE